MSGITKFWRPSSGNAGAEFALLLPLLTMLLFGGIEIGRLLHDYHVVSESVRDAGRFLSRAPVSCEGGTGSFVSPPGYLYSANENLARALSLVLTGDVNGDVSTGPYLLGYWSDTSTVNIDVQCIDNSAGDFQGLYSDYDYVPHIVVTATVPFTFMFGQLVTSSSTINLVLSHNVVSEEPCKQNASGQLKCS